MKTGIKIVIGVVAGIAATYGAIQLYKKFGPQTTTEEKKPEEGGGGGAGGDSAGKLTDVVPVVVIGGGPSRSYYPHPIIASGGFHIPVHHTSGTPTHTHGTPTPTTGYHAPVARGAGFHSTT